MESEDSEDGETPTFDLELTASQLYSLNTLLKYNVISMEDPVYSDISQTLALEVNEVICTEDFNTAFEEQMENYEEAYLEEETGNFVSNGPGVQ